MGGGARMRQWNCTPSHICISSLRGGAGNEFVKHVEGNVVNLDMKGAQIGRAIYDVLGNSSTPLWKVSFQKDL